MWYYFTRRHSRRRLESVFVLTQWRDGVLETFSLTDVADDLTSLGGSVERIGTQHVPVIKHTLREGLAASRGTQGTSKTEGFHDWQVRLDVVDRRTRALRFFDNHTSLLRNGGVDATQRLFRRLDFNQIDRLVQARLRREARSV